eukprot:gnl/TRDRNA2_/TRDRNA2_36014_c0_seq1.p1 gnl/TRDRNA2_/TRDRNA2_36014_c0~~gnl/TRDRNA2_/TRDRNA2_36014_c0_seq1.p1  ORF type:complete len:385 (+),score=95.20 gnl/TRDRNA2_/TRDRNA2_36014_c0_seq1:106-1260(+)
MPGRRAHYEFGKTLGRGSFGVVFKVKRKTDEALFVCKEIAVRSMDKKSREEAEKEVTLLKKISSGSPYIVQYVESFLEGESLHIIMEFCEHGDLSMYLKARNGKHLEEQVIWKFLIQVGLGLQWLHFNRILHRDIKTLNVFLTAKDDARIGDLGVARVLSSTQNFAKTFVGTPYYLSPELCEERPYNEKSDIWAYGIVAYEMCALKHPFDAKNQAALIVRILNGKYPPLSAELYPAELRDFVARCLEHDHTHRHSMEKLLSTPIVSKWAEKLGILVAEDGTHSQPMDPKRLQVEKRARTLSSQISKLYEEVASGLDKETRIVWENLYRFFRAKMVADLTNDDQDEIEKFVFEQLPTENTDLIWKAYKILQLEQQCAQVQAQLAE